MQKHTLPIQQTQKMHKKERKNKQQRSLHFVQGRVLVLFFLLYRTHADKLPDFR